MPIQTYRPSLSDTIYYGNPVNKDAPLNRGRVAWWLNLPLLKGRPKLTDLMGKYPGTLVGGPTWQGANGRPGGFGSLSFDGTDDYVDLGSANLLSSTSPFTLSWWERITSDTNSYPSRFFLAITGGTKGFLVIRSNHISYLAISFGTVNTGSVMQSTAAPSTSSCVGVWKHWLITCVTNPTSVTTSDYSLYVNGIPYEVIVGSTFGGSGNSTNRIGKDNIGDDATDAAMDDVSIYNRVFSSNEVYALYEASRRSYPNELNRLSRTAYFVGGAAPPAGGNNVIPFLASRVRGIGVGVTIG